MSKRKNSKVKDKKGKKSGMKNTLIILLILFLCAATAFIYAYINGWLDGSSLQTSNSPIASPFASPSVTQSPVPVETSSPEPTITPEIPIEPDDDTKIIDDFVKLQHHVEYLAARKKDVYSVSILDLVTAKRIDISNTLTYEDSFAYGICLVMYAYDEQTTNGFPADMLIEYTAPNPDFLKDEYTIKDLCGYVLLNSDKAAVQALTDLYGEHNVRAYMQDIGVKGDRVFDMTMCIQLFRQMYLSNETVYNDLYTLIRNEDVQSASIFNVDDTNSTFYSASIISSDNPFIFSLAGKQVDTKQSLEIYTDIYNALTMYFSEQGFTVDKKDTGYAVNVDTIDATAKTYTQRFKSYIMTPDNQIVMAYGSSEDIWFYESEDYSQIDGVTTFRGNNQRDGGAFDTVTIAEEKLEEQWSYVIGGMTGAGSIWPGVGWTGQPCIVKWDSDMLSVMNVYEEYMNRDYLIEVIYATFDGNIYFLDLETGLATRHPIYIGVPVKGTVTVDPRGYPILYAGQGLESAVTNEGQERYRAFGYRIFSLIDNSLLYEIKGYDTFAPRPGWGAFDSSGILDIENDTYYECGENGVLYIVKLNTRFDKTNGTLTIDPIMTRYKYIFDSSYAYGIESSPSVYGKYMYFTDNYGSLICLDLTTLNIVWAYNTGDDADASVALEVCDDGVYIYTANEVDKRQQDDYCNLRKFDAMTGQLLWQMDVPCYYVDVINGGGLASPLIGKKDMEHLVIFNVSKTLEDSIWSGRLIAIDKESGNVVWEYKSPYSWSSPVAVYTADDKGYIVFCEHNGVISLIEGATGKLVTQTELSPGRMYKTIEATPAVYEDMIVIGTYAEKIYGVKIK